MPKIAEIEGTPNPNAVKFVLKEPLTWGITRSFDNAAAAESDALAAALFAIPHVSNVFYVDRWVSVTQDGGTPWPELLKQLAVPIRAAPAAEAFVPGAFTPRSMPINGQENPRLTRITELINEKIRPYLMSDGGDLEVLELDGNQLMVHYHGACGSCPSSLAGTLSAIENLVHTIEPDIEVVAV
ncbi:MAG: NifU family protein [Gammaproteobacteria bacterium]